ncbi:50S ribosomal protein L11 methyltransferase [Clostridium sp. Marseille-P299]|uniref:50S ribosomal protein L11 methyltransferase n=1 Tax=Clostridium sp. Marseille-P299 TaxID=1805477 RepID=UPI0008345414|nr:50S ribosomal protein L11 methyltransferase [Clostridium sp. Marseille-P299]
MKWKKLTLETTTEAVDLVSSMLDEIGIQGIEIEDKVPITEEEKQRMFIDILPELGPDDGVANVNFYLDVEEDENEIILKVKEGLEELSAFVNIGSGEIKASETEDKDWMNNWKEFFKPFRVDDTIVIKPTWETLSEVKDTDLVIEIDPGTAFGTGSHETTKLCILNMKKYMKPGDNLLDLGCGSGILSIIGMKLGAKLAVATDIDENAVNASVENAEVNHLNVKRLEESDTVLRNEGLLELLDGNVIDDANLRKNIGQNCYDVVVSNILADVIIPLSDVVAEFMKPDGVWISSGIIDMKEEEVKQALDKNGFDIVEVTKMGDWVSIVAKVRK